MDSKTALEQVAYMHSLVEANRVRAAYGYPHFIWWGLVWGIAYLLEYHFRNGLSWDVLGPLGFLGSFVIAYSRRKRYSRNMPAMAKRIMLMNLILIIMCLVVAELIPSFYANYAQVTTYYAFWVGMIYILNGIFIDRVIIGIGAVIAVLAIVSHLFNPAMQLLILAGIGGCGLLVTGLYFRSIERQLNARSN